MLTNRQAFKVGFLLRCADEGLSSEEVKNRIEKAAMLFEKEADSKPGLLADAGKSALMAAIAVGAGLPIGAGLIGGTLAANLTSNPIDEEDVRKKELINEYKRLARKANQQTKLRLLHSQM